MNYYTGNVRGREEFPFLRNSPLDRTFSNRNEMKDCANFQRVWREKRVDTSVTPVARVRGWVVLENCSPFVGGLFIE